MCIRDSKDSRGSQTGYSALCEAAREEAGCAALPGEEVGCAALPEALPEVLVLSFVLLDTGRSALFEPAREEAGRFIEVVTMDALKRMVVNS